MKKDIKNKNKRFIKLKKINYRKGKETLKQSNLFPY